MSKSNTPNNKKIFIECAQNKRYTSSMCEHLQCVNNHYAKFEYKGMKTSVVTEYTNQTPSTHFGWKCLSSTSLKMRKYSWNVHKMKVRVFNMSTIIMQSLNKKEWKLLQLQITQTRHPKSVVGGQTDGWSGPITRPAYAKMMLAGTNVTVWSL